MHQHQTLNGVLPAALSTEPSDLVLSTTILQGLLASGHYTTNTGSGSPRLRTITDTDHRGASKNLTVAVHDSIRLLNELKASLQATP